MAKKILTAAAALAISFALFFYVVMVVGPEYQDTFRNVKVEIIGQDVLEQRGLMVIGEVDNLSVDLVLSGNRKDLNKLSSSNISVTLDVSQINGPVDTPFDYKISYPGNVSQGAVVVESKNPAGIALNVVWTEKKTIPVQVYFDEYIQLDDVANKVLISPPQQNPPEVKAIGKHLSVVFMEDLQDSTME